jgi:hypothetical protein
MHAPLVKIINQPSSYRQGMPSTMIPGIDAGIKKPPTEAGGFKKLNWHKA